MSDQHAARLIPEVAIRYVGARRRCPDAIREPANVAAYHPSGDPTPSREDHDVTKRLADAGRILGITVLDHVVWARGDGVHSIRESHPGHLSP